MLKVFVKLKKNLQKDPTGICIFHQKMLSTGTLAFRGNVHYPILWIIYVCAREDVDDDIITHLQTKEEAWTGSRE
jgi:hypothetical protein